MPEHRRRFELTFDEGSLTGIDVRRLHVIDTSLERDIVGRLGPNLCGAYDQAAAIDRLADAGDRPLAGALLDQRIVAGFGNIYAVETPFICGLSPRACCGSFGGSSGQGRAG